RSSSAFRCWRGGSPARRPPPAPARPAPPRGRNPVFFSPPPPPAPARLRAVWPPSRAPGRRPPPRAPPAPAPENTRGSRGPAARQLQLRGGRLGLAGAQVEAGQHQPGRRQRRLLLDRRLELHQRLVELALVEQLRGLLDLGDLLRLPAARGRRGEPQRHG